MIHFKCAGCGDFMSVIDQAGKEALNFQISMAIYDDRRMQEYKYPPAVK